MGNQNFDRGKLYGASRGVDLEAVDMSWQVHALLFFFKVRYFANTLRNETNGKKIVTIVPVCCFIDSNVLRIFPFCSNTNIC